MAGYGILGYRERILLIFVNGINWDWGIFRLKIIRMWEIYILFFNIFLSLIIVYNIIYCGYLFGYYICCLINFVKYFWLIFFMVVLKLFFRFWYVNNY